MCTSGDGKVVFHPNGNYIHGYNIVTGDFVLKLGAHFDSVHAVVANPFTQELYSSGTDSQVLVWTPQMDQLEIETSFDHTSDVINLFFFLVFVFFLWLISPLNMDVDRWSDEET
jgi:WD40 repeat protein